MSKSEIYGPRLTKANFHSQPSPTIKQHIQKAINEKRVSTNISTFKTIDKINFN
jgi:hypothetical protein